jgi:hypothetical protein
VDETFYGKPADVDEKREVRKLNFYTNKASRIKFGVEAIKDDNY